jgi:hypothetical protein
MKFSSPWLLLVIAWCSSGMARAQVEIVTNAGPQCVFFGGAKNISVTVHNPGVHFFQGEIRARVLQTSSATTVQVGEVLWKTLSVMPQQTVLESAQLDFPAVKAETEFLVQWLDNSSHVLGRTEVLVYPSNLLAELKPLAGDEPLGVFDPQNQLKPLLKNLKLEFTDLEKSGLGNFSGRLAIIGPFESPAQMRNGLAGLLPALVKKDAAVVWIQPPPARGGKLIPSFYSVLENTNTVVIVQPEWVADLADNPQSQHNLIYFCRQALHPQPLTLPGLSPQP